MTFYYYLGRNLPGNKNYEYVRFDVYMPSDTCIDPVNMGRGLPSKLSATFCVIWRVFAHDVTYINLGIMGQVSPGN